MSVVKRPGYYVKISIFIFTIIFSLSSCSGKSLLQNKAEVSVSSGSTMTSEPAGTGAASGKAGSTSPSPLGTEASPSLSLRISTPAAPASDSVKDYFPFEKDRHMVYAGGGFENSGFELYTDYIAGSRIQLSENNGATNLVHVYEISGGELKLVYNEGEVYHRYNYTGLTNRNEILLKEPIKAGTTWKLEDGTVRTITGVNKAVDTPSGKYDAIEVTSAKDDWTLKDYYAKGVGLVKRVYTMPKDNFTMASDLSKLEKGLPFRQTIKLFFPDVLNDKIISTERTVEILTNEDMKWKFQKELKTPPENSGLPKVLSANTQINSIRLDQAKDMVIADFSSHLVKEMNAGTSYESMLLKCIVKTLGNYYQKGRVMITLDGKPYESGHIIMKPGEYFNVE
jgi:hypothetical protein